MIEESYVRLYANDFAKLAVRAEAQAIDPAAVTKRMTEARSHAELMDARKGEGHLEALVTRLRDEARRPPTQRFADNGNDPEAIERRQDFLTHVADELSAQTVEA